MEWGGVEKQEFSPRGDALLALPITSRPSSAAAPVAAAGSSAKTRK